MSKRSLGGLRNGLGFGVWLCRDDPVTNVVRGSSVTCDPCWRDLFVDLSGSFVEASVQGTYRNLD